MKHLNLIFFILLATAPRPAFAFSVDRYHSQLEISVFMRQVAGVHREIATFHQLGFSAKGREIDYLVLGKRDQKKPVRVFLNGTHHGNEKSSTESTLAIIDYLVRNKHDPAIASLLGRYEFYIMPLVNPDGHASGTRGDANGKDPNRDYAYPESGADQSFTLAETKLVKKLLDTVQFDGAIAFHSGMEGVLWPWCYTPIPTEHQMKFRSLAKDAAQAMDVGMYKQSWLDYPTKGEFTDYMYMSQGAIALTFEVSGVPTPPAANLRHIVGRAIKGTLAFARGLSGQHDHNVTSEFNFFTPYRSLRLAGFINVDPAVH